jgi:phosphatidylglycerophosphate synthase
MIRHIPNLLTGSRLLLAAVFFALLSFYQYSGRGDPTLLNVAFILYVIALFTDYLDGYLARKWSVEGAFGRVVDPFVDKILVLGSFIFFSGKNFIIPAPDQASDAGFVAHTITGVAPAVVVLLLGRELLVTSLRSLIEGTGHGFGAVWAGKVKMVVQSGTILVILAYVNYIEQLRGWGIEHPARVFRDICIWGTVLVTLWSGVGYVRSAIRSYSSAAIR